MDMFRETDIDKDISAIESYCACVVHDDRNVLHALARQPRFGK
jgi:hypothetical protein